MNILSEGDLEADLEEDSSKRVKCIPGADSAQSQGAIPCHFLEAATLPKLMHQINVCDVQDI